MRTRQDFARELTLLRERSGMTVRQVAVASGAQGAHSTVGDWFSGRGLPSPALRELLVRVLTVCGVDDPSEIERWLQAWRRIRRAPGRRPRGPEPYRGLASFQPEDAEWFFGRDALTTRLIDRLATRHSGGAATPGSAGGGHQAGANIQVVVGPSGSGKSSLLRAGLIPAVRAGALPGSARWPVVLCTPGARPADHLNERLATLARPGPLLLVVDQFEEMFTLCAEERSRRDFVAALVTAAHRGAVVVLGLRADFYAQVLRYPQLVEAVQANQLAVVPMTEPELRAAIVAPARKARLDVEAGLVELLLRDIAPRGAHDGIRDGAHDGVHDAGVLPLLSHALYATWSRSQGRRLTIGEYVAVGGIDGAVAASASAAYEELTDRQRHIARRLFLNLVHVAPDTADTRRRVQTRELFDGGDAADTEEVLDRFVAHRLVTADADTVEISHEALLTAWPRLRAWLDADRTRLVTIRRLTEAAETWRREHRDPAALYRGTRLAAVQDWLDTTGGGADLTPLAHEFLDASVRREAEERRAAQRRTRRLRQLVAALIVLFLLTAAAGGVAVDSRQTARQQRDTALSGKVANEATAIRPVNPALAAQLSLAAHQLSPTAEARGSLLSSFAAPYAARLTDHTLAVYAAQLSPDGRLLATAGLDHAVRLYDATDRHRPRPVAAFTAHPAGVTAAVFSPDGRLLATAGDDRAVRLWDVTDPRHPRVTATLTGHTQGVRRVSFSPDGRALASAGYDGVRLWDLSDPRQPVRSATLAGAGIASFSPDGRLLATKGADDTIKLWDLADRRDPRPVVDLAGHTDVVLCAVFSPDGRFLATGSFDNTVRLWDVTDPRRPGPPTVLTGHRGGTVALAFSLDRQLMASGSYDGTVRLWDVTDPRAVGGPVTLEGHADTVFTVAFSPDAGTVISGGRDNSVRLWALRGHLLPGHQGAVGAVAVSPDGSVLAAGSGRTARLWRIADRNHPAALATLTAHTGNLSAVAFSPDGKLLATASLDFTTRLWNVTDPRRADPLAILAEHSHNVFAVAFSPDRRTLATASADQTVRLWNVSDPRRPKVTATIRGHEGAVFDVAFSPDGRILATAGADRVVRLWALDAAGRSGPLALLTGHTQDVFSVAFAPDGRTFVSGGADYTARVWDVADPRRPRVLTVLTAHSNSVIAVALSPDGKRLATAGGDRTVRLWELAETRPPDTLVGHGDVINDVVFSRDGSMIVTGGSDATTRFWDIDVTRVAARVCAVAHPRMSVAEWDRYFPDLPRRPPCG